MAADKGYLPWCIVSRVHVTQPSLQRAMEKVGVWADVFRDAEVMRELDHEWRMLKRELYNLRIKRYAEKFAMLSKTTANSILAGHTAVLIATFLCEV